VWTDFPSTLRRFMNCLYHEFFYCPTTWESDR
jgi:hypothetical protein